MIVLRRMIPVIVLSAVSAVVAANVVWLQEGRRGGFGPQGNILRMDRLLAALNTNNDELISAAELNNAGTALKQLDQNGDGQLSAEEVRPNFGPGGGGRLGEGERRGLGASGGQGANMSDEMVQTLMEFDRNSDGKLSKAEVPERMQGLFQRSDANQDGLLTRDELKKSAESQPAGPGGPGGPGGRPGGPGGPMRSLAFAALDANNDGVLSSAEMNNAPQALKALDKNGDGNLSEDEVRPNFPNEGRGRGPRGNPTEMVNHLIEENDRNGDGKLSKEEAPERMRELFERGDANQDGFLTKEELLKLFESGGGFGGRREGSERRPPERF